MRKKNGSMVDRSKGGSVELGEELATAAAREIFEETGIERDALKISNTFNAKDVILRKGNQIEFHYVLNQVCAILQKETDVKAGMKKMCVNDKGDDAADVKWVDVEEMTSVSGIVDKAYESTKLALKLLDANLLSFS